MLPDEKMLSLTKVLLGIGLVLCPLSEASLAIMLVGHPPQTWAQWVSAAILLTLLGVGILWMLWIAWKDFDWFRIKEPKPMEWLDDESD